MSAEFLGGFKRKIKKLIEEPEETEDIYIVQSSEEWLAEYLTEHPDILEPENTGQINTKLTPQDIGKHVLDREIKRGLWDV